MPLPNNWNGAFYDKESQGDCIFDLTPKEFVRAIYAQQPESGPFLVAGAVYDLSWNDPDGQTYADRTRKLLAAAIDAEESYAKSRKKVSGTPWYAVFVILRASKEMARKGVPQATINSVAHNTMASFFRGGFTLEVFEPVLSRD